MNFFLNEPTNALGFVTGILFHFVAEHFGIFIYEVCSHQLQAVQSHTL
jgi:hypothetical protein